VVIRNDHHRPNDLLVCGLRGAEAPLYLPVR
jgi:hypothetical protein